MKKTILFRVYAILDKPRGRFTFITGGGGTGNLREDAGGMQLLCSPSDKIMPLPLFFCCIPRPPVAFCLSCKRQSRVRHEAYIRLAQKGNGFNLKGVSAFSNSVGKQIAADSITVVDDGILPNLRGSISVDSTPDCNLLTEHGILKEYISEQVDITSGKFVSLSSEAYLIQNGKVTQPIKERTLTGDDSVVLKKYLWLQRFKVSLEDKKYFYDRSSEVDNDLLRIIIETDFSISICDKIDSITGRSSKSVPQSRISCQKVIVTILCLIAQRFSESLQNHYVSEYVQVDETPKIATVLSLERLSILQHLILDMSRINPYQPLPNTKIRIMKLTFDVLPFLLVSLAGLGECITAACAAVVSQQATIEVTEMK
ncbi:putative Zn-dependent protease TldD [Dirofilaria immitis]|nr:putative Zn-dependent protease TldD [Dirofilaria immitis]